MTYNDLAKKSQPPCETNVPYLGAAARRRFARADLGRNIRWSRSGSQRVSTSNGCSTVIHVQALLIAASLVVIKTLGHK